MAITTVDRTSEQELRLRAIQVSSEDTCCFWNKKETTQVGLRRCFYCEHYRQNGDDEYNGICGYKVADA